MPHFFIDSSTVNKGFIKISDKNIYKHVAKALRIKVGENLLLIDENQIQYEVKVLNITTSKIETKVLKSYKSKRMLNFSLYLAQSPLKSDAQTLVVDQSTQLGIKGLYPIYTENCALKKEFAKKRTEKWQKIMFESSKQCERADIPVCFELSDLENVLMDNKFDKVLVFVERNADYELKEYLNKNIIKHGEKVLVIIGPEGGFSEREFEFFKEKRLITLSLGNLILKAETATSVALGNIILNE